MYEINKEKFGTFLSQLRRERGMTQKDLAEKLYVSDKAVSKWERALSLPDIALLRPLAEMLEVTVTELLIGERVAPDRPLTVAEVEPLVGGRAAGAEGPQKALGAVSGAGGPGLSAGDAGCGEACPHFLGSVGNALASAPLWTALWGVLHLL